MPVAITRHGDTIGYYIPVRRKRIESERTALKEAAARSIPPSKRVPG
jgi:PHD/YefM family antitoxin component YafN of YafNO toxin-antitoxin module